MARQNTLNAAATSSIVRAAIHAPSDSEACIVCAVTDATAAAVVVGGRTKAVLVVAVAVGASAPG